MSAVVYGSRNRALRYAALFSLALHALLLFGLSVQRDAARHDTPEAPIVARLVQPPAPAPPAKPAPEPQSPPKPEPAPPVVKRPASPVPKKPPAAVAKKPPRAAAKKPLPQKPPPPMAPPEAQVAPDPGPPPSMPTAPSVETTAPSVETTPPAPPPAAAAPRPATLEDTIAQFRRQLHDMAARYKRYPRIAMDNNWEGEVVVRMAVDANGGIAALTVHASSGHEVLDRQALEMFRRAKPLVAIPPALRGREFAVELRAIYNLEDRGSG